MARLGLKNRQALWTQRQTLIRKQRVTYTPDAGNRAGQYRLIPFDKGLAPASIAAACALVTPISPLSTSAVCWGVFPLKWAMGDT